MITKRTVGELWNAIGVDGMTSVATVRKFILVISLSPVPNDPPAGVMVTPTRPSTLVLLVIVQSGASAPQTNVGGCENGLTL